MPKISLSKKHRVVKKRLPCHFCKNKVTELTYNNVELITRFLTSRGKIIGRTYSGTCARHQKSLSQAIKRARTLSLLPFIESHAIS